MTDNDDPGCYAAGSGSESWYMSKLRRNRLIKRITIAVSAVALLLLLILVLTNAAGLSEKKKELESKISEIEESIQQQNERTLKLEEQREYMKTREFTEDVARDKLGLVYPGEIVLKADT